MTIKSIIRTLPVLLAVLFAIGSVDVAAQTRKKPVIKRKPTTVKPAPKPVIKLYKVDSGTVFRVRMNGTISSKTSKVGDTFTTTITEAVRSADGIVVMPEGTQVLGRIDTVIPAKKGGEPGQISVSFVSVKLPTGTSRAISGSLSELDTKTAKSDNESTASGDKMKNRKIIFIGGGGAGGAVLGAAIGGGKGAIIGGIIGAGAGLLGDRLTKGEEAEVKSGTEFGVMLNQTVSMQKWVEPVE